MRTLALLCLLAGAFLVSCGDSPSSPSLDAAWEQQSSMLPMGEGCDGGDGHDGGDCGGGGGGGCEGGGAKFNRCNTACEPGLDDLPADTDFVGCEYRITGIGHGGASELTVHLAAGFQVDYLCTNPGGKTLPRLQRTIRTSTARNVYADPQGRVDGEIASVSDPALLTCPVSKVPNPPERWTVTILGTHLVNYELFAIIDGRRIDYDPSGHHSH